MTQNDVNTLTFDANVVEDIANKAVLSVDGVLATQGDAFDKVQDAVSKTDEAEGVDAEVGEVEVAIDLDIIVEYGKEIPKIQSEIVKTVSHDVNKSTGLTVVEVNVNVKDIMKLEDFKKVQMKQFSDEDNKSDKQ
ncbi:Asp23/Gls24 family envelope stress response protein [Aerococcus kribbianus]|uniref:Stress response regulator gls24 homolog n=1 Tax=Aerococcus kribbianus TaxID=2999064 RepID=A0A9X3JDR2_9LACT|nr:MULTISPECIES: Asp23/Gls24 family envelope stress response protein [unclassified Aerococcus]MCZ0717770.1 Asp23/Gls24 family envelope stress response protein [Aerococcus sp. YH-aer221]MCZ0726058.1 Asp23/Gls24 family envelope stress response protein [Aerococcus sp. YH-aer222]